MLDLDKFKKPDGTWDSAAFNAAREQERGERRANGELCSQCWAFMLWPVGHPRRCGECEAIDKPAELRHHSQIRCPQCGYHWRVGDSDDYEVYGEGTHPVTCGRCEADFEVVTYVSHTFTSPARQKEEPAAKEPEEKA
jgi:DNA-directed RNA polymerase subunit RPC12/RpoP